MSSTNQAAAISSSQAARHSSESTEHYTPKDVVERARTVLGDIDLDPATSKAANWTVRAAEYFTKERNGFTAPWYGNVFLNPPGGWCDVDGRTLIKKTASHGGPCTETGACGLEPGHKHVGCYSSQKQWWGKLAAEWLSGAVDQAIFICFSVELLQTTQTDPRSPVLPLAFPLCFPKARIAYVDASGAPQTSPPHSSCIVYLPPGVVGDHPGRRFEKAFGDLGTCLLTSTWRQHRAPR